MKPVSCKDTGHIHGEVWTFTDRDPIVEKFCTGQPAPDSGWELPLRKEKFEILAFLCGLVSFFLLGLLVGTAFL